MFSGEPKANDVKPFDASAQNNPMIDALQCDAIVRSMQNQALESASTVEKVQSYSYEKFMKNFVTHLKACGLGLNSSFFSDPVLRDTILHLGKKKDFLTFCDLGGSTSQGYLFLKADSSKHDTIKELMNNLNEIFGKEFCTVVQKSNRDKKYYNPYKKSASKALLKFPSLKSSHTLK